jgi:catechol 2,3-dioxygenase-like lactoylglutathione lyase family enzyme
MLMVRTDRRQAFALPPSILSRERRVMPDVIGIDHIYVTVSDLDRSERFYDVVMPALGFRKNAFHIAGDRHVQYFNRHFGFVLRPARSTSPHDPYAAGLHHLCFRVESQDHVNRAAQALRAGGINVSAPCPYPEYAPDYFACFFSDPDGVRLEITNYRAERRHRHDHWDELAP